MSCGGKSLWFVLRRCVAVRQLTVPTASGRCGFTQQRAWTSAARTACVRRLCELQPAVRSSQSGTCEDEYPPLPAYQPESEPEAKEVYIVQVKGLPWSCKAQDLLQFFSDCRIRDGVKGIHLTADRLGRPSGRAFIEMEHEEDVSKALEKHRQYLGPRFIEVYEVTNGDAEAILRKATQPPAADGVVLLRGLPFTCTEVDIVHFFSGLEIMENGITMVTDSRGRKSGEAFVQFTSQEAADEALQRDREIIGNRYVEVFPSRSDDIHSTRRRRTSPFSSQTSSQSVSRRSGEEVSTVLLHYVHVRGLPFQVSGEDIVKFFSPLVVSKILIECGPDGRPSGEADVYFSCHRDAVAAMSRDRMNMGHRYIELFLNSVPDCDER
uniref:G-rich RNA sequence binding factor 1 n=1 Tax=Amphilophus citrinellus TaxID=61819 RepID=A0A3Q0R5Z6_AMPCI